VSNFTGPALKLVPASELDEVGHCPVHLSFKWMQPRVEIP